MTMASPSSKARHSPLVPQRSKALGVSPHPALTLRRAPGCDAVLPVDLAIRISDGMFPCSFYLNGCTNKGGSTAGQYVKLFKLARLFRLIKLLRLVRLGRLITKYQVGP